MTNQFLGNYNLFDVYKSFSNYILCNFHDRHEKIWYLNDPKLIDSLKSTIIKPNNSVNTLNNNFVTSNEKVNVVNYSSKFDKKNKPSNQVEDILDIKKKKSKLQKKNRKQLSLDTEGLFINKKNNVILNEENLNASIIKAPKLNKNKKKSRTIDNIGNINQLDINNKKISKEISINAPLTVQELSSKLFIPEAEIITYLFMKGISVTINQVIDISIATEVALKYEFKVIEKNIDDKLISVDINDSKNIVSNNYIKRPPIITILGHVDHGKTTLLDAILDSNLVKQEIGGITQSIASYEIEWLYNSDLYKLVFLDTPGHEAFSSMRIRGTQVTDLVLLVVAADDGLKPQTIESIQYILSQKLPYIIIINKIDKISINTIKVREELAQYNMIDEDWGGNSIIIEVSALKRQNIDTLLSKICLLANIKDFKANPYQLATGMILESHLDQQKGPIANLVIKDGTLKIGDFIIAGNLYGKVKIILDNHKNKIINALPSSIVEVVGFSSVPQAGIVFKVVNNQKAAKQSIENNLDDNSLNNNSLNSLNNRITLENYKNNLSLKKLNLILKTDSQGASEAIISAFNQISQEKVQINILSVTSGNISNTDIELATATDSIIIGFNVNIPNQVNSLAKQLNIAVNNFGIIYDLIDYVSSCMLSLVDLEYDKVMIGKAIVQTIFYINKGAVAGCLVNNGKLKKQAHLNIYRDNKLIYSGILDSLKRLKDDVYEVNQGNECGVMSYDYNLWKKDDIIEAYELQAKTKVL